MLVCRDHSLKLVDEFGLKLVERNVGPLIGWLLSIGVLNMNWAGVAPGDHGPIGNDSLGKIHLDVNCQ